MFLTNIFLHFRYAELSWVVWFNNCFFLIQTSCQHLQSQIICANSNKIVDKSKNLMNFNHRSSKIMFNLSLFFCYICSNALWCNDAVMCTKRSFSLKILKIWKKWRQNGKFDFSDVCKESVASCCDACGALWHLRYLQQIWSDRIGFDLR